ncbi:MAG: Gfo/Idh/MocA family oxidoreductase [Gemmatimonadetes bacterium]|nr:Gfo/Idh/MocA family oxidoreductase [Gemmatimonadota bacterium]MDE3260061.1 Gfo/Idh/MocA family oxidoreductase [Gemmatimonadota bacterium]
MADGNLGFGIVGCGVIAPTHRLAIDACDEAELMAVCDTDENQIRSFLAGMDGGAGGVRTYSNYRELVRDPQVDVVSVCTPSGLHCEGVTAAARAGKHVLCEKPLEIDADRLTEMTAACRDAGVKLGCVFQSRTSPDMIRARQAIQDGLLGRMILADAYLKDYRSQAYYRSAGWRGTWALDGGGALMNQGVHGVDLLLWLMGSPVESVFARAEHKVRDIEVEDTAVANLRFKNGAYGALIGTTSCNPGEARRIELHGDRGTITVSGSSITRWASTVEEDGRAEDSEPPKEIEIEGAVADPSDIGSSGHVFLVDDLVRAIREDREPYVTGESARGAVDLILAIYQSARSGREVEVRQAG